MISVKSVSQMITIIEIIKTPSKVERKKGEITEKYLSNEESHKQSNELFDNFNRQTIIGINKAQVDINLERANLLNEKESLQDKRRNLQSAMQTKKDSDNRLSFVLNSGVLKDFDLAWGLGLYSEYNGSCKNKALKQSVFKMLSKKKEDQISELLAKKQIKDKAAAQKAYEDIEKFELDINKTVLSQLLELMY